MKWTREHTIRQFYDDCYRVQKHAACSQATVADFRIAINRFHAFLAGQRSESGAPRLCDLNDDNVSAFQAWIVEQEGCVPETANKYSASLQAIWRHAKRRKALRTLPDVDSLKCPDHARKTWTPEQFDRLLQTARRQEGYLGPVPARVFWPCLLLVICNTAGRINAVMQIDLLQDVDFERDVLTLRHQHAKDKSELRFPLLTDTKAAIVELMRYLRDFDADRGRLFGCWPWDRQQLRAIHEGQAPKKGSSWSILRKHYKRILRQAGLPTGRRDLFHCLRAYTATRITASKGIKAAQAFCDHSAESVTWAYIDKLQAGMALDLTEIFPEHAGPTSPPLPPAGPFLRVFTGDEAVA